MMILRCLTAVNAARDRVRAAAAVRPALEEWDKN